MGFKLPAVFDSSASSSAGVPLFGPSVEAIPAEFKEIPYETFSKSDRQLNYPRPADWFATDPAYASSSNAGAGGSRGARGAPRPSHYDAAAGDDEGSFSLVDKSGGSGFRSGRGGGGPGGSLGGNRGFNARGGRGGARGGASGRGGPGGARGGWGGRGRGAAVLGRGGYGGRGRWGDNHNQRTRNATVQVRQDWQILEEIEFSRLGKLRLEVDTEEPDEVAQYGFVSEYDKSYDRVNTRNSVPLQVIDRVHYNPTTSDDPVIQDLSSKSKARVFATDNILSLLMCSTRSVYPWDIVIVREGDKLFFDKRDVEESPFDTVSVNENASDPPAESERPKDVREEDFKDINSPSALSLEATYVNNTFTWQVVKDEATGGDASRIDFAQPNPFYSPEEVNPPASCGYRYRKFDLSINEEEDLEMIVRTEVDSFIKGAPTATANISTSEFKDTTGDENTYITIKTLFEFDPKAAGAGGAPDWRTKLDSQRGAVVATEMKNNSCKLARFAVQSILAGAEQMKMGYISRASPKDDNRHVILGTQWYKPRDFAVQMNVNLANGWGIVRTIVDLVMKQPEGKFCLIRDPNAPVIRLYKVPFEAFEPVEEDGEDGASGDESERDGFSL